jgi:DnaK suppressor protein
MSTLATTTTTPSPAPTMAWELFRVLLESQRDDCLRRRELVPAETIASNPDPVAMSRSATLLHTIAEVDAALDRIAAGTYGLCVHCGAAIPDERLELRPFAPGCVSPCTRRSTSGHWRSLCGLAAARSWKAST